MNRRDLLLAVIAAAASAGGAARAVADPADAAGLFLRNLYEREIERHNKRLPSDHKVFDSMFTREMRELMSAPRVASANMTLGPILHALFGRGVLPGSEVTLNGVSSIRNDDGISAVKVALTARGGPRDVTVILLKQDGEWRINDIEYGPGDTLAGHYRRMTGR